MKNCFFVCIAFIFFGANCNVSQNSVNTDSMHNHTNALINETSPYLLQHAHNPVDWMPWGEAAFKKAKDEEKLVLVSIGYSACHWCHVMEHETFEDSTAAAFMNEHFVCIKVDREERPDVDQVYMNAVQLMTQRGGWPLNCFTLADGRPIYGGTYFPKQNWMETMQSLLDLKQNDPKKMEEYASNLTEGVKQSELISKNESDAAFNEDDIHALVKEWSAGWDRQKGGPNRAPKFPLPNNYEFLLQYAWHNDDKEVLNFVENTLAQMAFGGIYDQVGGGFARYSTDVNWKVPHFEKMLYDNAQLVSLYSQAYQLTGKDLYRQVVEETLEFVDRELSGTDGQFYSALDADSEGEEGKFYVWSEQELKLALGDYYSFAESYYNINRKGSWEGNYILLRDKSDSEIIKDLNTTQEDINHNKQEIATILMDIRSTRVRPGLDDKTLTSWNALMVKALCDAYMAIGSDEYLKRAEKCANFILDKQLTAAGSLNHSYKEGRSTINGYLEDYSFTIEALVALYESTFDDRWLNEAKQLANYTIEHFYDEKTSMFWFTSDIDPPLIARKQELMDNVVPASNSSMAKGLFALGVLFDNKAYKETSKQMLSNMVPEFNYGQNVTNWAMLHMWHTQTMYEVAVTDDGQDQLASQLRAYYLPNILLMGGESNSTLPLLEGKFLGSPTIFVCENKTCQLPVSDVESALKQMRK
jgi:uncharacterized protein